MSTIIISLAVAAAAVALGALAVGLCRAASRGDETPAPQPAMRLDDRGQHSLSLPAGHRSCWAADDPAAYRARRGIVEDGAA